MLGIIAQLVERWFEAPKVAGSIPADSIFKRLYYKIKKDGVSISYAGVCAALAPNTIINSESR